MAIDYGRQLESKYSLKIDDCSLVAAKQSLIMIENTQVRQVEISTAFFAYIVPVKLFSPAQKLENLASNLKIVDD